MEMEIVDSLYSQIEILHFNYIRNKFIVLIGTK